MIPWGVCPADSLGSLGLLTGRFWKASPSPWSAGRGDECTNCGTGSVVAQRWRHADLSCVAG